MKDFFPVFMSSSSSLMNECLSAAERPGDWCSPPKRGSLSFPGFFFDVSLAAAVVEKVFDSQANNFPLCTSLFPPLFLPLITLPVLRANSWNQRSVTHLLLLLYKPPPPRCPLSLFFYLPGEHRTKQKQVSGYGSCERGSPTGGGNQFP